MSSSSKRPLPPPQPTRKTTPLNYEELHRAAQAQHSLQTREHTIWISNSRETSVAQTELDLMKQVHKPHEPPNQRQTKALWQDAKYGDRVPDAVWEQMRDAEKPQKKSKKGIGKGKAKEYRDIKHEPPGGKRSYGDRMDIDDEEESEGEEAEEGGVPISNASSPSTVRSSRPPGSFQRA